VIHFTHINSDIQ